MSFADLIASVNRAAQRVLGGEPVVYDPAGAGAPVTITGIFDEQYLLERNEHGDPVAGTVRPAVFVLLSDLPTDTAQGPIDFNNPTASPTPMATVTVRGVNYRILWRQTDGMGGVLLVLMRIA